MDPRSILEPSPFSLYSACSSSYTEQNNSASRLQASLFSCRTQSNGTEASVIAPESLHDSRYHGSDSSSILPPVQNMPNYQLHLCGPPNPHPHLPAEGMPWSISFCIKCVGKSVTYRICPQWCTDSLDLSLTHGQVPDSLFEGYPPNGAGAIHAAPIRWGHHNAVPWEDTNPQMELTVIEDHNRVSLSQNIHGVPSPSDLLESSPPMIADDFSSLYGGSYTSSEVQDSCADVTSSPGEARSTTSPVETHRQDATTQEASQQSQQPSTKKQKDKVRKRVQRSEDCQHFTKICTLLKIPPGPKKALAYRILVGVQALVERQEHDSDLQRRLEESEAEVAALREDLARVSAERTTGSRLGIKAGTALGGLDTDAIRQ